MPITYEVVLSDAENKALGVIAASQQDWIDNAVHERCRIAISGREQSLRRNRRGGAHGRAQRLHADGERRGMLWPGGRQRRG